MAQQKERSIFTRFTTKTSEILGRPWVFITALILLIAWAASGPVLQFSDTWQLAVNTTTTIVTFLMVFIIQNTQNRENLAMNLKLDTLLKAEGIDSKDLVAAEDKSDKQLEKDKKQEKRRADNHRKKS